MITMIGYGSAAVILNAHFFIFPTDPVYPICHLIPIPILGPLTYVLFSLINFYTICKIMCSFLFWTDNIILTYFVFWELMSHETRMGMLKYKVSNNLRKLPNIIYYHRALQICLQMTMNSMGLLLPVTHLVVIKLSLYTQVSLIRKWNQLDNLTIAILLFSWASGQCVWLFALHFSGKMVKESKITLISWKAINIWGNKDNNKFMHKFRKSCKPMTINYHNVYILRRSSILKFLKSVCRGTLRALLTIRNRRY